MRYLSPYRYPFETAPRSLIDLVWSKGRQVSGYDPAVWRADRCGAVMLYSQHGDRDSQYGWEIDHIRPTALGGGDELSNLQPLNWRNNAKKGDTYPWSCS